MSGLLEAPVLAHVVRDGFVESVHHGLAVITAPDGTVEFAAGDPTTVLFPRSANKPIHAVAALRAGASPTSEALALACASHSGARIHLDGVRAALSAVGLDEGRLRNVAALPLGEEECHAWLRAGRGPERITQCCSGNHAGMLAACVADGWDLEDYLEPGHPMQQLARATTEELAGESTGALAVDGCGATLFALPLVGLARAYGRIAGADRGPERDVAEAMRTHPLLVAGEGRTSSKLMAAIPGLIAKSGAEGVFAAGLPDGRGIALKITDGAARASGPVLGALLTRLLPDLSDAIAQATHTPVMGGEEAVGEIRVSGLGPAGIASE